MTLPARLYLTADYDRDLSMEIEDFDQPGVVVTIDLAGRDCSQFVLSPDQCGSVCDWLTRWIES